MILEIPRQVSISNQIMFKLIFIPAVENAKIFKEEFLKRNVKVQSGVLNL